jgi:hypothetical protein
LAISFSHGSSTGPTLLKLAYTRGRGRSTLGNNGAGNDFYTNDSDYDYYEPSHRRHWGRIFMIIVLVFLALFALGWLWFWPFLQLKSYSRFSGEQMVAQVCATAGHAPYTISIELITYDNEGHILTHAPYLVSGNQWNLRGEIITSSVDAPGLDNAYKIIGIEGNLKDSSTAKKDINLANGDDSFFKKVQSNRVLYLNETASNTSTGFWSVDGTTKVYDVFVSQNGFSVEQAPASAVKSCMLSDSAVPAP